MEERSINVSYYKTINLGNYNSIKVGGGFSRQLGIDEDRKEEFVKDFNRLKKIVNKLAEGEV